LFIMTDSFTSNQLALFPELFRIPTIPSISTLPEFDRAMDNLIKMSDLGAFVSVNIHGVDKSYSVHIFELEIPNDFLKNGSDNLVSPVYHLFPKEIRHQLRRLTYDIKNFFNRQNSFKTPFGYFLFRPYFRIWMKFVDDRKTQIQMFLEDTLSGKKYSRYFLTTFDKGYRFLSHIKDDTAPWEFSENILMNHIREVRKDIESQNLTLHTLDKTYPDYPLKAIAVKTHHFPIDLRNYIDNLQIKFAFKSIHLENLKNITIRSVEDVKRLSSKMGEE